jgi:ribosomal protein S21
LREIEFHEKGTAKRRKQMAAAVKREQKKKATEFMVVGRKRKR